MNCNSCGAPQTGKLNCEYCGTEPLAPCFIYKDGAIDRYHVKYLGRPGYVIPVNDINGIRMLTNDNWVSLHK